MKNLLLLFLFSLTLLSPAQAPSHLATQPFSPSELSTIHTLSPLPALPADPTNKYADSSAAALLGQKLFFEPRLYPSNPRSSVVRFALPGFLRVSAPPR